jgi:hypothetical protein
MKHRILLNGDKAKELDSPVTITVYTKCPEKWMLTDMETGEHYRGTNKSLEINQLNKNMKSSTYVIWDKMV